MPLLPKKTLKNYPSIVLDLRALWNSLSKKLKIKFFQLLFLLLLGGVTEVISLGAIIPFLAILINPQEALQLPIVIWILEILRIDINKDFYGQLLLVFSAIMITAYMFRFLLTYSTVKFNYKLGHELGIGIYKNVLYDTYDIHIARNSSEIISGLHKLDRFIGLVLTSLTAFTSLVLIIFITTTLAFINPLMTVFMFFSLAISYIIFSFFSKNILKINSNIISSNTTRRFQAAQEGMGSIRDILLDNSQKVFLRDFKKLDHQLRNAQASNEIIGPSPRYLIEVVGILIIVFYAYYALNNFADASIIIPSLGILILGLQRLIPLGQQAYYGWTLFNGHKEIFHDVIRLIKGPAFKDKAKDENLIFNKKLEFKKISFRYSSHLPLILNDLNFKITKGSRVGIIGGTGCGKSTLVDLLIGLLDPSTGSILIDGLALEGKYKKSWQKNIAHVPQDVYLLDASFMANIAFGKLEEDIDIERVKWSSKKAQISDFIESSANGFHTLIGEKGVSLSGGQKQRIAIARALYKKSSVLVFDEATSALDVNTEKLLVSSLELLDSDITIIVIAHRLSTVASCDWVYKLNKGIIENQGSPQDML